MQPTNARINRRDAKDAESRERNWIARSVVLAAVCTLVCLSGASAAETEALREVGVAKIDITPDYPVRLSGYAVRKSESEGIAQHLWARAVALGGDREKVAILITVDNCGVPYSVIRIATRSEEHTSELQSRF